MLSQFDTVMTLLAIPQNNAPRTQHYVSSLVSNDTRVPYFPMIPTGTLYSSMCKVQVF